MARSEQCDHLFDLDDLLGRAAKKPEQRFAERLAQNTQPRKSSEAAIEMQIAAPRERIDLPGEFSVESQVVDQSRFKIGGMR